MQIYIKDDAILNLTQYLLSMYLTPVGYLCLVQRNKNFRLKPETTDLLTLPEALVRHFGTIPIINLYAISVRAMGLKSDALGLLLFLIKIVLEFFQLTGTTNSFKILLNIS